MLKKLMITVMAAFMAAVVGCKSIPTPEGMATTSYAVGAAAGMVANQTKIDDASRNVVIAIMNEVDSCIPQTNQTFEAAWMPIAKAHTQKLIDEKKIDAGQGELILGAFDVACKGIDYLMKVRYPKAMEYTELIEAGAHGFCDGFLSTFKPANSVSAGAKMMVDAEAYEYLKTYKNLK